jgi:Lon protease-like protein
MSYDLSVPSSFDGTVRLFPLPNLVLFPEVIEPLHIFEPRYRQMTADALATDRLIAMVLLKSAREEVGAERPALHRVACLGKILADERFEDGRYNIVLQGFRRLRILSEINHDKLYRSARVELLYDTGAPTTEEVRAYLRELSQFVIPWLKAIRLASEPVTKLLEAGLPLKEVVDVLASTLALKIEFKQELLEELDVGKRTRRLLHYLQTERPSKSAAPPREFPPDFSTN